MRYLPFVLLVALIVYCLIDCARSEEEDRSGLPKAIWMLIVLIPLFGALAWLAVSRGNRRGASAAQPPTRPQSRPPTRRRSTGPLAPDDDPEFLWRLDQARRRDRQQHEADDEPHEGPTDGTTSDDNTPGDRPEH